MTRRGGSNRSLALLALAAVAAGCAGEKAQGRPWVHAVELRRPPASAKEAPRPLGGVDENDMLGHLAIETTSRVPLAPRRYLDPFTLETDRARIEAYYRAHGYFAARVLEAEVKPRGTQPESVDVHILVDEGPATLIRAITINGLERLDKATAAAARAALTLAVGQVLNHPRYLSEKDALLLALRTRGHAWAQAAGDVIVDRDQRLADITLQVVPGPVARFGRVGVQGETTIAPLLIAGRAGIPTGARFDPVRLEEARRALEALQLFSSVKADLQRDPKHDDVANVIFTVRDAPRRELRVGFGLGLEGSQRFDGHTQVIHTWRNFLGGLRTLQLRAELGLVFLFTSSPFTYGPTATAEAQLSQPDVMWRGVTFHWTAAYDVGIDYGFQYHGPRTRIGLSQALWRDRIRLGTSYGFQFLDFFNQAFTLDDEKHTSAFFGYVDPYRVGWLQQDLVLDLRDRPIDARSGIYLAFTAEEATAYQGSDFDYAKLVPEGRVYIPLGKQVVIAARAMFGQILVFGQNGSPITRRFYLGGPNSHRGFYFNRLSPEVETAQGRKIPIGGDQMFLAQAEIRVELGKLSGVGFGLVAFFDAGDVAAANCPLGTCKLPKGSSTPFASLDFSRLHLAVGGGLRVRTSVGTLRLDVGYRLNRVVEEPDGTRNPQAGVPGHPQVGDPVAVHISVGEAF